MELNPKLTSKQWILYESFLSDAISEILYWWSWRCWKTWWVWEILNLTCIAFPWIVWLVGRREWDDLRKTSLNTILKVLRTHNMEKGVHYEINMQTKELTYYNGSKVFFVPLKSQPHDMEFNWLWWYEITYAWVDEAQEVMRKAIDILKTRMTEKVMEYNIVPKVIMTCNPMKWHLYNDFIKPDKEWTLKSDRIFIPALYKDNPYIDHEKYEKQYENADEITRQRILFGNWEYDNTPWRLFSYDKILDLANNPIINWKKYITCDVARFGSDKAVIKVRDWFQIIETIIYDKSSIRDLENKIRELSQKYWIPMSQVIVDEDWVWWWLVDNLSCKWFVNNSTPIDTRSSQQKIEWHPKPNYQNLKTQCYFMLSSCVNNWFIVIWWEKIEAFIRVDTLSDKLKEELDIIVQEWIDKDWPMKIISKEDMVKKLGRSPDEADSVMMRMRFELKAQPSFDIFIW